MAVYERTYKRYVGALSPQWSRLFVLPRYAFKDVFRSKLFLVYFVVCLLPPLVLAAGIYFYHEGASIFEVLPGSEEFFQELVKIDADLFGFMTAFQCGLAFIATLFVGPGLVSKDLANNGLPLYLSRPISRAEYVLGKFAVLGILLSLITWIPVAGLYFLQSGYAGWSWGISNLRILAGIFIGSWAWIATIAFLALALSAWVKWRPVASFMMFLVFLGGGFVGLMVNALFRTDLGHLVNLGVVLDRILEGLFGLRPSVDLSVGAAWMSLATFIAVCIFMLHRKIRAYEVVS